MGYNPGGRKESDTTEHLHFSLGKRFFLSQSPREDCHHVKPEGPGDHMIQNHIQSMNTAGVGF